MRIPLRKPKGPNDGYTASVLAHLTRRFGPSLQARYGRRAEIRAFDVTVPTSVQLNAANAWKSRFLGYSMPPGRKVDGTHPSRLASAAAARAALERFPVPDVDGAWDFTAEFGVVLVLSPGHSVLAPSLSTSRDLQVVLATAESDVAGFTGYLDTEYRRLAREAPTLEELNDGPSLPLAMDEEDLILQAPLRQTLRHDATTFIQGRDWYRANGLAWRRGVLLWGSPGNGKTMATRMLARTFIEGDGRVFTFTGMPRNVRVLPDAVRRAAEEAPSLLMLEDVDGMTPHAVARNVLLNAIDGAGGCEGVFIVATTNFPERVDPALIGRAGRFDRTIHFPDPGTQERRAYFQRMWRGKPQEPLISTAAAATTGLSFANLNEVHHFTALSVLDTGQAPPEEDLRAYVQSMRTVARAKETGRWGDSNGFRSPVGFGAEAAREEDRA